jgi:predicted DNA-binding transcriptional regulator AlpA
MLTQEKPWMSLQEIADLLGIKLKTAYNMLTEESFPVPTYKLGKQRVADRAVLARYFEMKRAEGMAQLEKNFKPRR